MTKLTITEAKKPNQPSPSLTYFVKMPHPNSHLFEVGLQIEQWSNPVLNLKMPVWTPGSYLVREYARHIQDFKAVSKDKQKKLLSQKVSKNHWQIETKEVENVLITYRVYANELTVRTNHLDNTHGYFNGAALFYLIPGLETTPITVEIIPPNSTWKVSTALPDIPGKVNQFYAQDFDTLVDSPFEIGNHAVYSFEVLGKPHQYAIWGTGNIQPNKLIEDTKKIIETEAKLFGGLPYDDYLFILHLTHNSFGGLEHKNSCSLIYSRFYFKDTDKYNRFLQLVAHEFFHLWNVKRIRPKALETFDYEQENYTPSLWFSEGTTSYYDMVIPLRAGIYNAKKFLEILGKEITRFLTTPGRKVQPLSESSFDAWIKLYRRDNNSDNCQISYYLKGELVSLLLDLLIRAKHQNKRSLDNVMLQMWEQFGKSEIGFTPHQLQQVIESVADMDLQSFFNLYVDSIEELPFNKYLNPFGLQLKPVMEDEGVPYLGIRVQSENNKEIIKFVEKGSPASLEGIDPEDELLAINGIRVTAEELNERLKDHQADEIVSVTVFHQDELRTFSITLGKPQPSRYEVVQIENPSPLQQDNLTGWLGKI
ncbi:Peptidase M61, glycyl monoaminopeptidase [Crocosphaera subtropica ATCC 51142]|uniref:Peptidase M61, glycyl monoaminopeptidase n=1 Tax=Crocosphaera subtropica (strain ATCC 51142 / BH68) TaxID=43989 RepID=B1WXX6_CROS5|nr:M61 family metallopeptidase [Crocosphaera subtropica]ACB50963.1 Peptidase M61, glycyl monoaminopeptidase [Crocosphaera subtropica ATCC 51142]